jgi:Raf kinase inhibitor-like YbhB/YbcL family protein
MKTHRWLAPLALASLTLQAHAEPFTLKSAAFGNKGTLPGAQVFNGFGCQGGNQSPALAWSGAPKGTLSFVLTVYDPDAPTGSGWWHWVVYDIPAGVRQLSAGAGAAQGPAMPAGARQARNDFGAHAFGGACPPQGDAPHRYVFTLHALSVAHLAVPADASPALIGFMTRQNTIATATLTGRYGR